MPEPIGRTCLARPILSYIYVEEGERVGGGGGGSQATCAGILEQSKGVRNQVGIGLSYPSARLHRLAESIPGLLKGLKYRV